MSDVLRATDWGLIAADCPGGHVAAEHRSLLFAFEAPGPGGKPRATVTDLLEAAGGSSPTLLVVRSTADEVGPPLAVRCGWDVLV